MSDNKGHAESNCAVCKSHEPSGARMSKVLIEGRALALCRAHAATVAAAMPATFEDLRALFIGAEVDVDALLKRDLVAERRSPLQRREPLDRRVFPPRPEGRRRASGRRTGDPLE